MTDAHSREAAFCDGLDAERVQFRGFAYQQRTQRQQRPGQALIQPGAQPQAPVKPLQAA
jgi:hypothetical protein